jgi:hypothetical protein
MLTEFTKATGNDVSQIMGPIVTVTMKIKDQDSGIRTVHRQMTAFEAHDLLTFSPERGVSILSARIDHDEWTDVWGTSGPFTFDPGQTF